MKRLVFCFDGTWNRLDTPHPTNVAITAESVKHLGEDNTAQLIYYDEGVGAEKGEKLRGGLFGTGLLKNLGDAYRFLIFNYTPGDQIYVFGFSRGAYTARSFVGLLNHCAILRPRDAAKVNDVIQRYQERASGSDRLSEDMCRFRSEFSPEVCVCSEEDEWRSENIPSHRLGSRPLLKVEYLGVWDTVGSLGIPSRYMFASWINSRYRFHDTVLSDFVRNARHAVAIDEHRVDFGPPLWDNLDQLNREVGKTSVEIDAPYQQKWFPGDHCSVGGGGERRGLSDQALDWIWDGARNSGLELDSSEGSRVYELKPDFSEHLTSSPPGNDIVSLAMRILPQKDRLPGPSSTGEVSISTQRRWAQTAGHLQDGEHYRPKTLSRIAAALNSPQDKGAPAGAASPATPGTFSVHIIQPSETLSKIAVAHFGDPAKAALIFDANRDKLDSPDRIYVGQAIRIPKV